MFQFQHFNKNKTTDINTHLNIEDEIRLRDEMRAFKLKTLSPVEFDKIFEDFKPKNVDTRLEVDEEDIKSKTVIDRYKRSVYRNGKEFLRSNFDLDEVEFHFDHYAEKLMLSYDVATSCIAPDVSSSSPSMVLHQIATILFTRVTNLNFKLEQSLGTYRADLLIDDYMVDGKRVVVDTCANLSNKEMELSKKGLKYIIIDKYNLVDPNTVVLKTIIKMSKDCDSRELHVLYDKVITQSDGTEMLYSKDTIDFLTGKDGKHRLFVSMRTASRRVLRTRLSHPRPPKTHNVAESFLASKERLVKAMIGCDSPYTAITYSEIGEGPTVEDINDFKSEEKESKEFKLFTRCHCVTIDERFREGIEEDTEQIAQKDLRELYMGTSIAQLIKDRIYLSRIDRVFKHAVARRSGYTLLKDGTFKLKERFEMLEKFLMNTIPVERHFCDFRENLRTPVNIDPAHENIMKMNSCSDLIPLFERSREYNDLRFRERIARALFIARKPESRISVKHWLSGKVKAECYIRGLLFEKDKGIAVVSFIDTDRLIKTEKWRLSDLESFNKGPDTLVACMVGLLLKARELSVHLTPDTIRKIFRLYSKLITENSWAVGSFLKPFRYWTSGLCMSSASLENGVSKIIESLCDSNVKKFSLRLIKDYLSDTNSSPGTTALFGLPFSMIGFECFLVNLTPSKTYGSKRHLRGCMTDLINEIRLANGNFSRVKSVITDFEDILKSGFEDFSYTQQIMRMEKHFDLIDELSESTSGRFTLSPISIIMISESIDQIPRALYQKTVPHLSNIMTTKASWDSTTSRSMMAIESISSLIVDSKETTTTGILYYILSSSNPLDLFMRMFDKDQVAGNREISILSNIFRILQSICESFSKAIGKETGIDMLDNSQKVQILGSRYSLSRESKVRKLVTMDQTRWGPNFNTALFGWMFSYMMRNTTEAYIPCLVCLLSEFKVFGTPEELIDMYIQSDHVYSNVGNLGRFHMAQGIFHYTSSLYHAMVNKTQLSLLSEIFSNTIYSQRYYLNASNLVTSDDAAIIIYLDKIKVNSLRKEKIPEFTADQYQEISDNLESGIMNMMTCYKYFNILTSSYKNIISEDYLEFNSFYLGPKAVGSNDLKYLSSLVINQTSGTFWQDFQNSITTYGDAINSGCSRANAKLLSQINVFRIAKMWRIEEYTLDFDDRLLTYGFPRFSDPIGEFSQKFGDQNRLRFKTRERIEGSRVISSSLIDEMINIKAGKLSSTKTKSNYKTIFVPNVDCRREILIRNPNYKGTDALSLDFDTIFRMSLEDRGNIYSFHDLEEQVPYTEFFMESDKGSMNYGYVDVMINVDSPDTLVQKLVSSFKRVEVINRQSSLDEIILHTMRVNHVLRMKETELDLTDLYIKLSDEIENAQRGCVREFKYRDELTPYKVLCYTKRTDIREETYNPHLQVTTVGEIAEIQNVMEYYSTPSNYFGYVKVGSRGVSQSTIVSGYKTSSSTPITVNVDIDLRDLDYRDTFSEMLDFENIPDSYLIIKSTVTPEELSDETNNFSNEEMLFKLANADLDSEYDVPIDQEYVMPKLHTYSVRCQKPSAILFTKVWSRPMVVANKLFEILHKSRLVKNVAKGLDKVSATATYLDRGGIVTADPHLQAKINPLIQKTVSHLVQKNTENQESWIATSLWSIGYGEYDIDSVFCTNEFLYFSTSKIGQEISEVEAFNLINDTNFTSQY